MEFFNVIDRITVEEHDYNSITEDIISYTNNDYFLTRDSEYLICRSPTFNCQFYTVGGIEHAINNYELPELLKEARIVSNMKPMFLIDIHIDYKEDIYNVIKDNISKVPGTTLESEIVMDSNYTSTNFSVRCIMLIKSQIFK